MSANQDTVDYKTGGNEMKLRFLKKKDGSKVLQQQCPLKNYAWEDVPMVEEETVMGKLYSHLAEVEKIDKNRGKTFTILVSSKIMEDIKQHNRNNLRTLGCPTPNSFMYHRLYEVPSMVQDIKILVEV